MKKIFSLGIWTVALLCGMTACSSDELADQDSLPVAGEAAPVCFSLQATPEGTLDKEVLTRVLVAERSLDDASASDGQLYCPQHYRRVLDQPGSFVAKGLKLQWYKFSFFRVPDGIATVNHRVDGRQLFSDLRNTATPEEKQTCDFSKLLVDYSDVLRLQELEHSSTVNHDLHVYRGSVSRWMTRAAEGAALPQETVKLKRITGLLSFNMGILPDQFEHEVSTIVIQATLPTRVFVSDSQWADSDGGNQVVVDEASKKVSSYTYVVPDKYKKPDASEKCVLSMAVLPCLLEGTLTVHFTHSGVKPKVYTLQTENEQNPGLYVKSNTCTTVLFNGMKRGEFEVRYAGFPDSQVGVAPDNWEGWETTQPQQPTPAPAQ